MKEGEENDMRSLKRARKVKQEEEQFPASKRRKDQVLSGLSGGKRNNRHKRRRSEGERKGGPNATAFARDGLQSPVRLTITTREDVRYCGTPSIWH